MKDEDYLLETGVLGLLGCVSIWRGGQIEEWEAILGSSIVWTSSPASNVVTAYRASRR